MNSCRVLPFYEIMDSNVQEYKWEQPKYLTGPIWKKPLVQYTVIRLPDWELRAK